MRRSRWHSVIPSPSGLSTRWGWRTRKGSRPGLRRARPAPATSLHRHRVTGRQRWATSSPRIGRTARRRIRGRCGRCDRGLYCRVGARLLDRHVEDLEDLLLVVLELPQDLVQAQVGDGLGKGQDLLPQRGQLNDLLLAGQRLHRDDKLAGDGRGDAPEAFVVHRGREVLRHDDVRVADDQDDLKGDSHRGAVQQLAAAIASLVLRTVSSVTHTIATATS